MNYQYFSHNGHIKPVIDAVVPLGDVAYSYGYGVYETVRMAKGRVFYIQEHTSRLMESAKIIELEHNFTGEFVAEQVAKLVSKNDADACNIKILLIGGNSTDDANLYIICLNPLFPDRKLYRNGVHCITYEYEREFPHAKSLNMLPSYLAYRDAKQAGAYDALLINKKGEIVEGTRTNFFALKGHTIYTPPEAEILLGVTRDKVLVVAKQAGFEIVEKRLDLATIQDYDNVFLTSTSSKIMPIASIASYSWRTPNAELQALISAYDDFLTT